MKLKASMIGEQFLKPIVVVGSINADLVCQVNRIPEPGETLLGSNFKIYPGGKGANQAVAAARLGCAVNMIGKVGKDAFASLLRNSLNEAGVDTTAVETVDEASGVALIEVDAKGQNSIVVAPGANGCVQPQDLDCHIDLIREAGVVLVQLETPLKTVERLAQICVELGVPLILDPAPACELPDVVLRAVRWFTPNETEAAFYAGSITAEEQRDRLFARGVQGVILKRGAEGVQLAAQDGTHAELKAFRVQAVDTTAAGDAFNGAFAAALMLGGTPAEAVRFAAAAAAVSVTRAGAQPSMATRAEVEALLAEQG